MRCSCWQTTRWVQSQDCRSRPPTIGQRAWWRAKLNSKLKNIVQEAGKDVRSKRSPGFVVFRPVMEMEGHIPIGPVVLDEDANQRSTNNTQSLQSLTELEWTSVLGCNRDISLFLCYAWGAKVEKMRAFEPSAGRDEFPNVYDTHKEFSNCGDCNQSSSSCSFKGLIVKLVHCKCCGTFLIGPERDGLCGWKWNSSSCGVSFKRSQGQSSSGDLNALRTFRVHYVAINSLFTCGKSIWPWVCTSEGPHFSSYR